MTKQVLRHCHCLVCKNIDTETAHLPNGKTFTLNYPAGVTDITLGAGGGGGGVTTYTTVAAWNTARPNITDGSLIRLIADGTNVYIARPDGGTTNASLTEGVLTGVPASTTAVVTDTGNALFNTVNRVAGGTAAGLSDSRANQGTAGTTALQRTVLDFPTQANRRWTLTEAIGFFNTNFPDVDTITTTEAALRALHGGNTESPLVAWWFDESNRPTLMIGGAARPVVALGARGTADAWLLFDNATAIANGQTVTFPQAVSVDFPTVPAGTVGHVYAARGTGDDAFYDQLMIANSV